MGLSEVCRVHSFYRGLFWNHEYPLGSCAFPDERAAEWKCGYFGLTLFWSVAFPFAAVSLSWTISSFQRQYPFTVTLCHGGPFPQL